ncbi:hypothetical protein, partial [Methylobacterium sp. D48H]
MFEVLVLFGGISFDGSFRGVQILHAVSNLHFEYISRSMQIFASLFHLVTGVAPFDGADFHCDAAVLVECTLFDRTGSGAGLGSPAEVLSGREHAQAGVRVDGVVVLEP